MPRKTCYSSSPSFWRGGLWAQLYSSVCLHCLPLFDLNAGKKKRSTWVHEGCTQYRTDPGPDQTILDPLSGCILNFTLLFQVQICGIVHVCSLSRGHDLKRPRDDESKCLLWERPIDISNHYSCTPLSLVYWGCWLTHSTPGITPTNFNLNTGLSKALKYITQSTKLVQLIRTLK